MSSQLRKDLEKAEGRSGFVLAVFCDIRGFSKFSAGKESPDTAMFIKRFYIQLIDNYFKTASFVKPTGDGLLLIFKYSENTLKDVAKSAITQCFKCIEEFPSLFKNDPMINYATPQNVGFGITRGTACCLFSDKKTIDYSGQILNLAARLTDLARPKGIVIAGSFLMSSIPNEFHQKFKNQKAFIRPIAEEEAIEIFYSRSETRLPDSCLSPLINHKTKFYTREFTVAQIQKFNEFFTIELPDEVLFPQRTKFEILYPHKAVTGFTTSQNYNTFEYQ
jgi:hypothetical protein